MNVVQRIGTQILPSFMRLMVRLGQQDRIIQQMGRNMNSAETKRRSFAGYEAQPNDVFIATTSKSGTNWAMQITYQIAHLGNGEFDNIYSVIPWPDPPFPEVSVPLHDTSIAGAAPTGLRIIKTHWEADYVPYSGAAKYVVVLRDPKDVFVSGYHFIHEIVGGFGMRFSAEQWLKLFQTEDYPFGSWAAHTASWWAKRNRDNVLILHYAEMKRDSDKAIRAIASLMGVALTNEQFANVVARSSFAYMSANRAKFSPVLLGGVQPNTVRSGQAGQSAELLTPAQQRQIDRFAIAELQRLGSDFPYAELYQT